jgi:hypothetical protein
MRNVLLSSSAFALVLALGMATASAQVGGNGGNGGNGGAIIFNFSNFNTSGGDGGNGGNNFNPDSIVTEVKETHNFSNTVTNDWSWVKDVNEKVDIEIDIKPNIPDLTGLTQVSNAQKLFGSVDATTTINSTIAPSGSSLPVSLGSATALGNMFSLSGSDPTLLLNSDQIHKPSSNTPVDVTANLPSTVSGAAVKLDSKAISNMLSVNMSEPEVIVGSIMQTSYADVSATASSHQTIGAGYNHTNFADLSLKNIEGGVLVEAPNMNGVVTSVNATAIGNMASINLGSFASIPVGAGTSFDPK